MLWIFLLVLFGIDKVILEVFNKFIVYYFKLYIVDFWYVGYRLVFVVGRIMFMSVLFWCLSFEIS